MALEVSISIDALHEVLWSRRDSNGFVQVNQRELADQLAVSKSRVGHVLKRMQDEGRLQRALGSRGPYLVTEPGAR